MKRFIPVMLLILLMLICLAPPVAAAHASGQSAAAQEAGGLWPAGIKGGPAETYQVPGRELTLQEDQAFPAKYDPRTDADAKAWFPQAARVENQGYDTGLCWAFSATTAAELSWAKENYDEGQPLQDPPQLSPLHLGYFFYNWPGDPLGGTKGDINIQSPRKNWISTGGNNLWTLQYLANQADFIADEDMPFSIDENFKYKGPKSLDPDQCYSGTRLIMEDSELHVDLWDNPDGIDIMKSMITKYGAIMGSITNDFEFLKDDVAYYNPTFMVDRHAVAVVGWDDDYSRENFRPAVPRNELPAEDGAWLVQNSYGTVDPDGEKMNDDGYFWISYESIDLISNNLVSVNMAPAAAQTDVFQYDGTAAPESEMMEAGEICANVFSVPAGRLSEKLDRVGFTCFNEGPTDYTIEIHTGLKAGDAPADVTAPDGGTMALAQDVHTDVPGYHTFPLDAPVDLAAGETFSVCVKFKGTTKFGVEKSDDNFSAALVPGQSFRLSSEDGQWHDASDGQTQECFRIKAIATPQMCTEHDWEHVKTVKPAKAVKGYDVVMCRHCYITENTNETPALKPVPNKTSLTKLVPAKKAMTVKWKKSNEKIAGKNIDGYQIRYSLKKSMKGARTVTVKGYKVTSKKVRKLKSKKKYFVQVRTYKKTGSRTYYSGWSARRSVKAK